MRCRVRGAHSRLKARNNKKKTLIHNFRRHRCNKRCTLEAEGEKQHIHIHNFMSMELSYLEFYIESLSHLDQNGGWLNQNTVVVYT